MSYIVRQATKADAKLIADISHQTFYDTFAADNTTADMDKFLNEQFTKGKLMLEVGTAGMTFLLACQDDAVAGYVKLKEHHVPGLGSDNAMEIARLYALNNFLGKGVGKVLMEASVSYAREQGKDMIWLGVWEKNLRAIEFYKKWGFEKFGETDFLLGDDVQRDWLMRKDLATV